MRIFYCGFNGFNQWEASNDCNYGFKEVIFNHLETENDIKTFDLNIGWAYNLILLNSKVFIQGFHLDSLNAREELKNPNNDVISRVASNDEFILLYNDKTTNVWKYYLDADIEQKWKLLPDFTKVDCRISLSVCENADNNELILKIVSSDRMNIALTNKGRLFNIPYEIDCHCLGKIIDIECGYEHGILLTDLGNVYTWGGGSRCQLGHGNTEDYHEPELIEALSGIKIVKIAAGGWHSCVISEHGDLYTWGWNEKGQLGIFTYNDKSKVYTDNSKDNFSKVADCSEEKCEKKLKKNCEDETSHALPNYALPMVIDIHSSKSDKIEQNIVDVSCGSKHTVIKLEDGSIWGTGCNKYGQLGFPPNEIEFFHSFKKLNVNLNDTTIKCGMWATAVIVNDFK